MKLLICSLLLLVIATGYCQNRRWINHFTDNQNTFSGSLYWAISKEKPNKNVLFSPISVSQTLGMVLAGAMGNTYDEITRALQMTDLTPSRIHTLMRKTRNNVVMRPNGQTVKLANSVFIGSNYPVVQQYIDLLRQNYKSSVFPVNFHNSNAAANMINEWVSNMTEDKIRELVDPSSITAFTRMILVNAVYFQADWAISFRRIPTKQNFFLSNGTTVQVPFMVRWEAVVKSYNYRDKIEFFFIRYKTTSNQNTYFVVGLPGDNYNLQQFSREAQQILSRFRTINKMFRITHFKMPLIELSHKTDVKEVLQTLGVVDLFDSGASNLTGISTVEQLYVSEFTQKAYINVNENGTVAAAASAATVQGRSLSIPRQVTVDRPFFIGVYQEKSNSFLFLGKVENPLEN
uniref:serpin A3-5 isoform X1 n=1 Tax=Ciona intestinalis TaxID=7719 RepID=UPI000180C971|nr:serpin A3-5 isoform X1 [Ciona intestinalis]|eukprot:XP_002129317.1 serpin A3-5 isoform X1 [Ciona intestinalis]